MYEIFGISPQLENLSRKCDKELKERFEKIDEIAQINQLKVIAAMQKNHVSEACFAVSTGYGYGDLGRDTLEAVYADVFQTEDALVRPQITCGTHALGIALAANLRPGDEMLSATGQPYDTLEEVIGIRPSEGSLADYGITYRQVELTNDGHIDIKALLEAIEPKTKLIEFQRSRGYRTRPTLGVQEIGQAIRAVHEKYPKVICMVDNCYGEFIELEEPSQYGADMVVGSLIKNPGGGLAPAGGYIAGTKECVERCAHRLTTPGIGKEAGANFGVMQNLYFGFFVAPMVAASAEKSAIYAARIFEEFGYETFPHSSEIRHDIIQEITLGSREAMISFSKGVQAGAAVDAYVTPEPSEQPGYNCDIIMADGCFIQGSSIELSCDGPLREPFNIYFQGGITFTHGKLGVLKAAQSMIDDGLIKLNEINISNK